MLRAVDALHASVAPLFGRSSERLELIRNLDEARSFATRVNAPCEALFVPLSLHDGSSGITCCLQAKADPTLATLPIIGIVPSRDRSVVHSFYGAGADCVVSLPFEADSLYLQAEALARTYRGVRELGQSAKDSLALSAGTLSALEACRDPLLIFGSDYALMYSNAAARNVLLSEHGITAAQLPRLSEDLRPYLRAALTGQRSPVNESAAPTPFGISCTQVRGERGLPIGVAVRLSSTADIEHLGHCLEIGLRSESLALLGSAALLRALEEQHGGYPLTPLHQLTTAIAQEPTRCSVAPLITALTEIIDSVLPSSLEVSVSLEQDVPVAVRPSDLLQILGHIWIFAALQSGKDGALSISVDPDGTQMNASTVTILIVGEHSSRRLAVTRDYLQEAVPAFSTPAQAHGASRTSVPSSEKLVFGLEAAQKIADRYRISIEYKARHQSTKVRLRLPRAVPQQSSAT
jgi:CheY-like chemotaxis protein